MVLRHLFAAALVLRRRVLHRCAQAVSRGAACCASQVLDRGAQAGVAQADVRGATHILDRGAQAVARGAAHCALHVHGRGARTDACELPRGSRLS